MPWNPALIHDFLLLHLRQYCNPRLTCDEFRIGGGQLRKGLVDYGENKQNPMLYHYFHNQNSFSGTNPMIRNISMEESAIRFVVYATPIYPIILLLYWLTRYREWTNEPHQRPLFVKALWYPINGIHGIILQVAHQIHEWVLPSTLQECFQQGPFLVYVDVIRRLDIKGQFRDYM